MIDMRQVLLTVLPRVAAEEQFWSHKLTVGLDRRLLPLSMVQF